MPTGSATAPATISGSSASVSTGTNTITLSKTISVTPSVSAGYVASGTAGNSAVSLTGSVTTKAAATYYPGTTNQTIASGTYLTGAQTINALTQTNLDAGNIKNGTTISINNGQSDIWSVTGTYTGGGGSSALVQGTFTTGSSTGTVESITIPYTGSGFPLYCMVVIDGGAYNNTATGNTTWYNSLQRYAVGQWTFSKSIMDSTPTYGTSGSQNQGVTTWIYKNSTSQATTYSRSSAMNTNVLTSSNATGAGATCVRFKGNNGKTLSYYIASTSYGLLASTKYAYIVVYSS